MDRPQLGAALEYLRSGDTLVLWKLDRLGRNTRGVLELLDDLARRGVGLMSVTEEIDTTGPMGKAITTVMLAFGTLERDVLIERTRSGLDAARAQGRVGGRPTVVSAHKLSAARSLIRSGATVTAAAKAIDVSRSSLYRSISKADGSQLNVGSEGTPATQPAARDHPDRHGDHAGDTVADDEATAISSLAQSTGEAVRLRRRSHVGKDLPRSHSSL